MRVRDAAFLGLLLAVEISSLAIIGCKSASIESQLAGAEVSLKGLEDAALLYTRLPRCNGATPLCSAQATVDAIKSADNTAYNAIIQVRSNAGTIDAALSAINTLSALVPQPAPAATDAAHSALQGS